MFMSSIFNRVSPLSRDLTSSHLPRIRPPRRNIMTLKTAISVIKVYKAAGGSSGLEQQNNITTFISGCEGTWC